MWFFTQAVDSVNYCGLCSVPKVLHPFVPIIDIFQQRPGPGFWLVTVWLPVAEGLVAQGAGPAGAGKGC